MSLFTEEDDCDAVYDRRLVAATLVAEWMANMKAMRFELRSFLKAMAKAR